MTRYVIDASVAVEYLLRTPLGLTVAEIIEGATLVAPEMMDAEVLSVLRRAVSTGTPRRITSADRHRGPGALAGDRISHRALAPFAWKFHRAVSAYDAFYVAAARVHGVPLLTADGRLTRASGWALACSKSVLGEPDQLPRPDSHEYFPTPNGVL